MPADVSADTRDLYRSMAASCAAVTLVQARALFEAQYLVACLITAKGNKTRAAAIAGIGREGFWRAMRRHNLHGDLPDDSDDPEVAA